MKIHPTILTGLYGVFMGIYWALYKCFFFSFSEAQKGAEDKGQIKAQLGGRPATPFTLKRALCQLPGFRYATMRAYICSFDLEGG